MNARPEEQPDDVPTGPEHEITLGSEDEREDRASDDGELEGSESLRGVGAAQWVPTFISEDERERAGFPTTEPRMGGLDGIARATVWAYFWAFVPVEALDEALQIMTRKGQALYGRFELTRHTFFVYLGYWFRMCADRLRSRRSYWGEAITPQDWYRRQMSGKMFERITRVLSTKEYAQDAPQKVEECGEGPDKFSFFRCWLHACNTQFKRVWEPGVYLTVDETMVFWTGTGPVHLTYLPRKPDPLGVMFKVTCCSKTGILLHAELVLELGKG